MDVKTTLCAYWEGICSNNLTLHRSDLTDKQLHKLQNDCMIVAMVYTRFKIVHRFINIHIKYSNVV